MIHRLAIAAALICAPLAAVQAAEPAASVGMLGNHPAVVAHLLAIQAVIPAANPATVMADPAQHPAVIIHLRAMGGMIAPVAAPAVKTAFTHVDRHALVQIAANR